MPWAAGLMHPLAQVGASCRLPPWRAPRAGRL